MRFSLGYMCVVYTTKKKNKYYRKAASLDVCDVVVFRIFMILNIKNCPICQDYNKINSIRVYKCVFVYPFCWYNTTQ